MPSLRIEVAGQVFAARLPEGPLRIGSDAACEIRIDDPDVSAVHAVIEPLEGGGHKLVDGNSGRPTLVGGIVVKRVLLKPGDAIEIGPARLIYVVEGVTPAPAAPRPTPAPAPRAAPPPAPAARAPVPVPVPAAPVPPAPRPVAAVPAAVVPAAVPAAQAAPVAAVPAASPAAASGESATSPSPTAGAPPAAAPPTTAVRAARARSGRRLSIALSALAGFAVLAMLASGLLSSGDDPMQTVMAEKRDLERADELARAGDLEGAIELYERLSHSHTAGVSTAAVRNLAYSKKTVEEEGRDFKDLESRATRMEPADVSIAYDRLVEKYGPASAGRHADVKARVEAARAQWSKSLIDAARSSAEAHLSGGRFADALSAWTGLGAGTAPEEAKTAARAGASEVEQAAANAARRLEDQAAALAKEKGPRDAARFLRERLSDFAGTAALRTLSDRTLAFDAEAGPEAPTTMSSSSGSKPSPTPTPAAPTTAPPDADAAKRLAGLLAEGDSRMIAKRWGDAVQAYRAAVDFAKANPGAADAKARAELDAKRGDAEAAVDGLTLLAATVKEHPERFARVDVLPGFAASVTAVDADHVTAAVPGGTTKLSWASLDAARVEAVVEAAMVPAKDALPLVGLLSAAGARDAADALLARVALASDDKAAAFAALARMRREAVPAGGYVVHEKRLVSPAERDRRILEGKVAGAALKVTSKDAATRAAAYAEMKALGPSARPAFAAALRSRRAAAVKEVTENKSFTSGRIRQKLQQELEERRAAALAAIENPVTYPYPNPNHIGQDEVDRLVARVREVWDTPFELVASWDKSASEALALVAEVDEVLATVEDGYVADLAAVKAAISRAIDVQGISPDEYSRKVLAFNAKVGTTADGEEKDDVLAVNEYRIMLGRQAVKIHERLVRAARGHSIEMRVKDYFAHESPTPGLESPQKRAGQQGYGSGVGENIAMGSGGLSGRDAFDLWAHSSGHHRNMVSRGWTDMGAGRALHGGYWTQLFGATGKNLGDPEALPPPTPDVASEPDPDAPPGTPPVPTKPGKGRGRGRVPDKAPPPTAPPDGGGAPDPGPGMTEPPAMGA